MIDFKIIHILVTLFLLISYINLKKEIKIIKSEKFSQNNIDFEAIKSMGVIARGLQKNGFTIPGNLTINGNLKINRNLDVSRDLKVNGTLNPNKISGTYYIKSSDADLYLHSSGGSVSGHNNNLHICPKSNNHPNCQWQFQKSTTR